MSDNPLFKVTEINLDGAGSGTQGMQYIEIYNYGHDIDLSEITMSGFVETNQGSLPNINLTQGQYAVIYNTDTAQGVDQADIPSCLATNCLCDADPSTGSDPQRWFLNALILAVVYHVLIIIGNRLRVIVNL